MAKLNTLLLFLVGTFLYIGFVSALAHFKGVSPWQFWSGVVGAVGPWAAATLIVVFGSMLVPHAVQQAAGMAGLFPMLATFGVAILSPLVSLFLDAETGWEWRLKWFAIVSGVPAVLLTVALLAIFIKDSRHL